MAVSYRGFLIELYEEYLSDGGFVATQREDLLSNPCGLWKRLQHWEDRLEAYIDGLCVGGDLALEVCRRRAVEGEPGELHCALRVFCRQGRPELIEEALSAEPNLAPKRYNILSEALKHERAKSMPDIVNRLLSVNADLLQSIARIIGHQRLPLSELLVKSMNKTLSATVIWALGRLRDANAVSNLRGVPRSDDRDPTATLALLRTINYLDSREDWPPIAFGIMGSDSLAYELLDQKNKHSSLALGLLGHPSTITELISRLPCPVASLALQLITGAGLIEEKAAEDEMLEPGERPTTIRQISSDPGIWSAWWNHHQSDFAGHKSFRSGAPYSAETLSVLLMDTNQMQIERYWAAEQLATRHQMALSFEADMLVREQLDFFASLT